MRPQAACETAWAREGAGTGTGMRLVLLLLLMGVMVAELLLNSHVAPELHAVPARTPEHE